MGMNRTKIAIITYLRADPFFWSYIGDHCSFFNQYKWNNSLFWTVQKEWNCDGSIFEEETEIKCQILPFLPLIDFWLSWNKVKVDCLVPKCASYRWFNRQDNRIFPAYELLPMTEWMITGDIA